MSSPTSDVTLVAGEQLVAPVAGECDGHVPPGPSPLCAFTNVRNVIEAVARVVRRRVVDDRHSCNHDLSASSPDERC
jgi:hypothetical protein